MTSISTLKSAVLLLSCGVVVCMFGWHTARPSAAVDETGNGHNGNVTELKARIIATGIPGAGAVTEVGTFLTGGPLHEFRIADGFCMTGEPRL